MPPAPASSLQTWLCTLGNAMTAVMDMALYNLVLLRAQPRRHPRRKPQRFHHPARDMRTFPATLLLSAQVSDGPDPRFLELAAEGISGDLLLHPHETLARIGEMMEAASTVIRAGQKDGPLLGILVELAAKALWLKHFLAHARHHAQPPLKETVTVPDPLSVRLPRRPASGSWQMDARRMDRLAGRCWQDHIANLPDPWSDRPKITLHPLSAGRQHHGIWVTTEMAAALTAMASRHRTAAGAALGR